MAEPTDGVLIWAFQDVTLPNAGTINKIKPIDDLINKGWDRTQKPAAQEFNYVLNNHGQWIEYLRTSFIAGTPNNTPDTLVKRDPLGNFSATTITASLKGNALTADEADHALTADLATNATSAVSATNAVSSQTAERWATPRTISLTGYTQGTMNLDGSGNVSMLTVAGDGFINSKTTSGYTYLPNGLLMQWGFAEVIDNEYKTINLPIAFPNQILNATVTVKRRGAVYAGSVISAHVGSLTKTSIGIGVSSNDADYPTEGVYWTAIGF